jgi:hypothetical protein
MIEASPAKRGLREMYGSRENIPLDTHRIALKHRGGALSSEEFENELRRTSESRDSIVSILANAGALSNTLRSPSGFHIGELYLLYLKHRRTPADELLATEYATRDGRARMTQLAASCKALASDLRWVVPISECFAEHPMVDEMRRHVLRAGGSPEDPRSHPGWLKWFAEWLNEAAYKLERPRGGAAKDKESSFQLEWYDEATRRTSGNAAVVWEVGRRLFLLTFPEPAGRYTFPADFKRVVTRRVKERDR